MRGRLVPVLRMYCRCVSVVPSRELQVLTTVSVSAEVAIQLPSIGECCKHSTALVLYRCSSVAAITSGLEFSSNIPLKTGWQLETFKSTGQGP